jgi:hypothetical protein
MDLLIYMEQGLNIFKTNLLTSYMKDMTLQEKYACTLYYLDFFSNFNIILKKYKSMKFILLVVRILYHLCGLVVRVSDYRSRGPAFDSRRYHIFYQVAPQLYSRG